MTPKDLMLNKLAINKMMMLIDQDKNKTPITTWEDFKVEVSSEQGIDNNINFELFEELFFEGNESAVNTIKCIELCIMANLPKLETFDKDINNLKSQIIPTVPSPLSQPAEPIVVQIAPEQEITPQTKPETDFFSFRDNQQASHIETAQVVAHKIETTTIEAKPSVVVSVQSPITPTAKIETVVDVKPKSQTTTTTQAQTVAEILQNSKIKATDTQAVVEIFEKKPEKGLETSKTTIDLQERKQESMSAVVGIVANPTNKLKSAQNKSVDNEFFSESNKVTNPISEYFAKKEEPQTVAENPKTATTQAETVAEISNKINPQETTTVAEIKKNPIQAETIAEVLVLSESPQGRICKNYPDKGCMQFIPSNLRIDAKFCQAACRQAYFAKNNPDKIRANEKRHEKQRDYKRRFGKGYHELRPYGTNELDPTIKRLDL